ncbi:MAG TPA: hypothetical protein DC049_12110, partial [Spirochaetia bacterium]|nr:hypothetical protein [Spirochaetia bacterium]
MNNIRINILFLAILFITAYNIFPQITEQSNGGKAVKIEEIDTAMKGVKAQDGLKWTDCAGLTIEGRGFTDTEIFYDRFPLRARETVDNNVWNLSRHSAGMAVRFITTARSISARWKLRNNSLAMPHMPATGVSGLDLYIKSGTQWRWMGSGRPLKFPLCEAELAKIPVSGENEFILYLPLYNGVEQVEIGVPADADIRPASARGRPVVFYGTSILQGGCASRPGMAFPAMLGRRLDLPVINLGFSGNGRMQPEVISLIAEIDASAFVL